MAVKPSGRVAAAVAGGLGGGTLWLAAAALGAPEILGAPTVPWLTVAVAAGAVLGMVGLARWISAAAGLTIAALLVVGWVPGIDGLARGYIRSDSVTAGDPPRDAVIVLAAAVSSDGRMSPAGVDRLLEGLRLIRAGAAPRLVVSRVRAPGGTVTSDRDQRELAALLGSPVELHVLDSVGSTRIEAERARDLFAKHGWRTAIVVTSPVHTRRACATFEAVGIAVTCRASPDRTAAVHTQIHAGDRVAAFGQWLYETLGWWEYRARGWARGRE
jgi:uncharacterized SAM-binding protein YcdF (DUF218 family)